MTRLMKSSSLGGATPTVRPSHSRAPLNQFDGSWTSISGDQVSGPLKTTMSPGSGSPNQYGTLLTSTRSPVQPGHPCSVCSIDPEGMKKACTKKVLTSSASTKAISSRTGSSRSSEPFFFGSSRPGRGRRGGRAFAGGAVDGTGALPRWSPARACRSRAVRRPQGRRRRAPRAGRCSSRPAYGRVEPAGVLTGSPTGGGGAGRASARDRLALLLDLGSLAAQLTEVVQLRPADVAAGDDLDLLDDRGVHREGALDADAEAHLAHGEGLARAAALAADHDALEDLDPGAVALDDADVHLDGVAGTELGDVVAQRIGVECVQG